MSAVRPARRRPAWVLSDKGYGYPRVRAWCERRAEVRACAHGRAHT